MSQNGVNRRCRVRGEHPIRSASAASVAPVVTWSINAVNAWALVISGRRLIVEAPQVVHRHQVVPLLVVPLRFMAAPQWQRGRFFGRGTTTSLPYTTGRVQHRVFTMEEADICSPSIYFPCFSRSRVRNHRSGTHFLSYNPLPTTKPWRAKLAHSSSTRMLKEYLGPFAIRAALAFSSKTRRAGL